MMTRDDIRELELEKSVAAAKRAATIIRWADRCILTLIVVAGILGLALIAMCVMGCSSDGAGQEYTIDEEVSFTGSSAGKTLGCNDGDRLTNCVCLVYGGALTISEAYEGGWTCTVKPNGKATLRMTLHCVKG